MIVKFVTVSIYLVLGLWVVIFPLVAKATRGETSAVFRRPYVSALLLAALTIWVSWIDAAGNHKLLVGWIIVAAVAAFAVWRQWTPIAIGAFAGMAIASALPWWRHDPGFIQASHREVVYYVLISVVALGLLVRNFAANKIQLPVLWKYTAIIAFIPFALFLSFGTGIAENLNTQIAWWHHWGAYVGPAEIMLSGGHIFRDFPVQYGLGPTVAIAATCGSNCWVAMYYIVGATTFLLSVLVLCTALTLGIRFAPGIDRDSCGDANCVFFLDLLRSGIFITHSLPFRFRLAVYAGGCIGCDALPDRRQAGMGAQLAMDRP